MEHLRDDEPEAVIFDKHGNKAYINYKKNDRKDLAEKIFDKNGKQLDGSYRRIVADKIKREVCDRNSKTLVDTF